MLSNVEGPLSSTSLKAISTSSGPVCYLVWPICSLMCHCVMSVCSVNTLFSCGHFENTYISLTSFTGLFIKFLVYSFCILGENKKPGLHLGTPASSAADRMNPNITVTVHFKLSCLVILILEPGLQGVWWFGDIFVMSCHGYFNGATVWLYCLRQKIRPPPSHHTSKHCGSIQSW